MRFAPILFASALFTSIASTSPTNALPDVFRRDTDCSGMPCYGCNYACKECPGTVESGNGVVTCATTLAETCEVNVNCYEINGNVAGSAWCDGTSCTQVSSPYYL